MLVERGELLTMDEKTIVDEAKQHSREVVERAGLTAQMKGRWPVE